MGKLTIGYGLILVVMGIGWFIGTGSKSVTALIPTFLGIPVILCGILAEMKESLKMHAMHVAVLLGLIGLAGGGAMGIPKVLKGNTDAAPLEQSALAVISAIFVALCVKSFIDARRRRKAREASE
ncbi:hypothetical protein Mal52_24640 [Symmachiella dynata]|uniref:Uncharacterized protein n=1 Tax=Symmachiella dynata TaxID=2527995 RepID=A0A517ZNE1_9PLAN|nr:hypothetical protein [Symmachiella dynata]QDU43986.1 hypothetical protein Mal52_24640 [Symmachiella dynata]